MLEDGLIVQDTCSALSTLRPPFKKLKSKLDKKLSTIKRMKLEIGEIKQNVIIYC